MFRLQPIHRSGNPSWEGSDGFRVLGLGASGCRGSGVRGLGFIE